MSRKTRVLLLPMAFLALAMMAGPLGAQNQQAQAMFSNADGHNIGTASLTQTPAGVLIDVTINGVPAGAHGFHIHAIGTCDAPTFASAGDHYNPADAKHGFFAEGGYHAGDMPNQFVQEDGRLRAQVLNPHVTLGAGKSTLFDADGSALVLHTRADDYASQPSGEAGDRFACAVITRR